MTRLVINNATPATRANKLVAVAFCLLVTTVFTTLLQGQSASTGAVSVTAKDTTGGLIAGATVALANSSGVSRSNITGADGSYTFTLLPPDSYRITISAAGFKTLVLPSIEVHVSETATVSENLQIGQQQESVQVTAEASVLQTESAALGGVVGSNEIEALPLTTRNYQQIMNLSPGIVTDVNNATAAGRGIQNIYANGKDATNSNFKVDGVTVSNYAMGGQGNGFSDGSTPLISPDALQEFQVLTSNYDASYGRNSGANVNVVTKTGTNTVHGSAYEYFRNTDLNANTFFANETGSPRGVLNQNQFGGTVGGPIIKNKLFFFLSGEGLRQANGIASGGTTTPTLPEQLTNDRSLLTLENDFCAGNPNNATGKPGAAYAKTYGGGQQLTCPTGGPAGYGTNAIPVDTPGGLSSVALNLLNAKLPNGQYAIPTPQLLRGTSNGGLVGIASFSTPLTYNEAQGLGNLDWVLSSKNTLALRSYFDRDTTITPYTSTLPDGGSASLDGHKITSAKLTTLVTTNLVNQVQFAYDYSRASARSLIPFTNAQFGMAPSNPTSTLPPVIDVGGTGGSLFTSFGGIFDATKKPQQFFEWNDQISWNHGRHTIHAGYAQQQQQGYACNCGKLRGTLIFQTFADFLLGESAAQNGSPYSNIYSSQATVQLWSDPDLYRENNGSAFVQDDYKVSNRFTLNIGLRWEYLGTTYDNNKTGGTNGIWSLASTVPVPPASGTYVGFTVQQGYTGPEVPGLLTRSTNLFPLQGHAPFTNFAPRLGFAWQPFDKLVVRAGGGEYYDIIFEDQVNQTGGYNPPLAAGFVYSGTKNALATFSDPFNPALPPETWNGFARTPTSSQSMRGFYPRYTPTTYSWNATIQYEIKPSLVFQVGYVGNRSEHQMGQELFDYPQLATAGNPVNCGYPSGCITTNTAANAALRIPVLGFGVDQVQIASNSEDANYESLQVSLNKRLSHGFQFGGSYTYGRCFNDMTGTGSGAGLTANSGDPTNRASMYGPCDFNRPQRFVVNYSYFLPNYQRGNKFINAGLSGWSVSGVTTVQDGYPLTITNTTGGAVFGSPDVGVNPGGASRAQMCPGMTYADLNTSGSVVSRLTDYFNTSAINCAIPIVGAINGVGGATGFGNAGRGIVLGPGQLNFDASVLKRTEVGGLSEHAFLEFRADFFNASNHAQFGNPAVNVTQASFGVITATTVGPRIVQFALRYNF
jgi:hypothetical protein